MDLGYAFLLLALASEVLKLLHKHLLQLETLLVLEPDLVFAEVDEVNAVELLLVRQQFDIIELLLLHELEERLVEVVPEQVVV